MKNRYTKVFTRKLESWEQNSQEGDEKVSLPRPQAADEADEHVTAGYLFALEFPTGNRQVFQGLPLSIGRGEENDLVLSDATVSSKHARLYYDLYLKGVCIFDTHSLNGVFVDDLPVSRCFLTEGARIRLGAITLIFRELTNPPV